MSAQFRPGELVDVMIKGARIMEPKAAALNVLTLAYEEVEPGVFATIELRRPRAGSVTITHTAPAEWPPQPGDVWADKHGVKYFACQRREVEGVELLRTSGAGMSPDYVIKRYAPVTLVYREDWAPAALSTAVEASTTEADGPPAVDIVAALREIADLFEANPNMPRPRYYAGISYATTKSGDAAIAEVRAAADAMGVKVQSVVVAESGQRHWRAERRFGVLELTVAHIEPAPAATADVPAENSDGAQ